MKSPWTRELIDHYNADSFGRRGIDPLSTKGKKILDAAHKIYLKKIKRGRTEVQALNAAMEFAESYDPEDEKGEIRRFPRMRFPRLRETEAMLVEIPLRWPYPEIEHNKRRGKNRPENSGPAVLLATVQQSLEELQKRCANHGLSPEGTKFELVERLYRHWRASKLHLGFPLYGYAPGFEKVGDCNCSCGNAGLRRVTSKLIPRFVREEHMRFPRTKRFPRLPRFPRTKRFPRLKETKKHQHMFWYQMLPFNPNVGDD